MTVTTPGPVLRANPDAPRVAVLPTDHDRRTALEEAVVEGGGIVVEPEQAEAVVWADPGGPGQLRDLLGEQPNIRWVQLPFAGVEPFLDAIAAVEASRPTDGKVVWTCGKGVYAEPVAEHALALTLAGLRHIAGYARETSWSGPVGQNLLGARVVVLGGGDITRSFLRLLAPFGCHVTVVRRHPGPLEHADVVVGADGLDDALVDADVVVLALALTPETDRILDEHRIGLLPRHAWVVNVARGRHIDTTALVAALESARLGGAALDVTDPEPLPDGHPLWRLPNAIITPHIANTPEMGLPLLQRRVSENVARFADGRALLGHVDPVLEY